MGNTSLKKLTSAAGAAGSAPATEPTQIAGMRSTNSSREDIIRSLPRAKSRHSPRGKGTIAEFGRGLVYKAGSGRSVRPQSADLRLAPRIEYSHPGAGTQLFRAARLWQYGAGHEQSFQTKRHASQRLARLNSLRIPKPTSYGAGGGAGGASGAPPGGLAPGPGSGPRSSGRGALPSGD